LSSQAPPGRQAADPAAVAWWKTAISRPQGCMRQAPDPRDQAAVTAYNEALRQLAAEPAAQAGHPEPEPSP
jgi:hypothetical protein